MNKRSFVAAAVLTASLATVLAVGLTSAQNSAGVRIGAITTLTGRQAEFGRQQKAGFEVGVREVNARGGVNGARIELLLEDSASDVNKGLAAAEKLVNAGVGVVLNEYSSTIVKAQSQYLARQRVPNIVVSSSDETITKPGNDYTFRINPPTDEYARALFEVFKDSGVKTVAILAGTGAFEKSVQTSALEQAKAGNIEVVGNQSYDAGLTDFRPILNGFKARNPDAVFLVGYQQDSVAIMRQAREVNINPRVFAGAAAGYALPEFIKGGGPSSEHVIVATAWVPELKTPNNSRLYTNLVNALGGAEPTYHAAQAYAAVLVAADAIARAKSATDREAIKTALGTTNLSTAYAPVRFQDYSGYKNQNNARMIVQQVQKGTGGRLAFEPIYPKNTFSGKLNYPTPTWDKR